MNLPIAGSARRKLPDAGPSAAEYLVVLVAVAVVLAVTVLGMPRIGHGVREALCGQGCAAGSIPPAPVGRCRVLSHAEVVTTDAVVFTDDLGRSGRVTLSRTIDRDGVMHWFVRQDGGSGAGLGARAQALLALGGGQVTEFASEQAARDDLIAIQHEPVKRDLTRLDATGMVAAVGDEVDGHRLSPQPPDAFFVDGGDGLDLAAEAKSAVTGTGIAGGLDGIAEVRLTPRPGGTATTLYARLGSVAAASLGLFPPRVVGEQPATAPGGAGEEAVVSIGYDAQEQPAEVTIEAAGSLPGRLGPPFGSAGPEVLGGLLGPPAGDGGRRFTGRISMTLDLSDPLVRVTTADALHALGVPLLLDLGHPAEVAGAVADLYALLDSGARGTSVTINSYRLPAGLSTRPVVTLGLQGGLTIAGALPGADYYYAPHQGFVKWQVCDG